MKRRLLGPVLNVPITWRRVGPSVVVLQLQGWLPGAPRAEKRCSGALVTQACSPTELISSAPQASGTSCARPDQSSITGSQVTCAHIAVCRAPRGIQKALSLSPSRLEDRTKNGQT